MLIGWYMSKWTICNGNWIVVAWWKGFLVSLSERQCSQVGIFIFWVCLNNPSLANLLMCSKRTCQVEPLTMEEDITKQLPKVKLLEGSSWFKIKKKKKKLITKCRFLQKNCKKFKPHSSLKQLHNLGSIKRQLIKDFV